MAGKIIATCGHELKDEDDGHDVILGDCSCDAIDGFMPAISYNHFCQFCEAASRNWPERLYSKADEDLWFSGKHPAQGKVA